MMFAKRESRFAIAVGVLVACVLLDKFALGPFLDSWDAAEQELAELKQQAAQDELNLSSLTKLSQRWIAVQKAARVPSIARLQADLSGWLNGSARQAGIRLSSLDPQRPQPVKDEYQELPIRLEFTASLERLQRLLDTIVTCGDRLVHVQQIRISNPKGEGELLGVNLTVSAVFQLESAVSKTDASKKT